MELIVTLRKEVADIDEANTKVARLKQLIEPVLDVKVTALVNTHLATEGNTE